MQPGAARFDVFDDKLSSFPAASYLPRIPRIHLTILLARPDQLQYALMPDCDPKMMIDVLDVACT